MTWFKREDNAIVSDTAEDGAHRGAVDPVRELPAGDLQEGPGGRT